jgi:hypothetical protein
MLEDKVVAEATFQDVRTIRLKGSLPMAFNTEGELGKLGVYHWRTWMYAVPGPLSGKDEVEFTSTPDSSFKFIALRGSLTVEIDDPSVDPYRANNKRLTVSPKNGEDTWELAVVEREREPNVILPELKFPVIEDVEKGMQEDFEKYVRELCPWRKDWNTPEGKSDQLGCYVMWTSTVRAGGYFKKEAVLMSKLWMNKVRRDCLAYDQPEDKLMNRYGHGTIASIALLLLRDIPRTQLTN